MKFRAKMVETLSMKNLALIAATVSKLTKNCVLRLNRTTFSLLVCDENSSPKQILLWCVIRATQFFNEFNIEGLTQANEIYLELPPDMLATSLSTLKNSNNNARCVKIKLTDKMTPCITVEIELSSEYGIIRSCVHDIPVKVIPVQSWTDYSDPIEHDYNVSVEIGQIKKLRSVLERCKKLGPFVTIGTTDDLLSVTTSSQSVTVATIFKNAKVFVKKDDEDGDQNVRVDVKRICLLLFCEQLTPRKAVLNFFQNKIISFDLTCDNFTLHFFLLAVEE